MFLLKGLRPGKYRERTERHAKGAVTITMDLIGADDSSVATGPSGG